MSQQGPRGDPRLALQASRGELGADKPRLTERRFGTPQSVAGDALSRRANRLLNQRQTT